MYSLQQTEINIKFINACKVTRIQVSSFKEHEFSLFKSIQ